jgi:phenylacetate-coenzyme A ligase PaaK-like adenylate-forming protein
MVEFSESFKRSVFDISGRNFNEKALELFRFQSENNLVYQKFLESLKVKTSEINTIDSIPFLPIEFFKTQKVVTGSFIPQQVFHSSGTTGQERSNHYIKDTVFYKEVARKAFESIYGLLENYIILALLPSYQENKNSSLIHMMNHFIENAGNGSMYVSSDFDQWKEILTKARKTGKKVILWAVTYALLDLADSHPQDLSDLIVIETGGMKGRRKEITREELHALLKARFKLEQVHSEYGMSELLSQAYSKEEGVFSTPAWMKILIRDVNDPLSLVSGNREGAINIIDLANVDSCAFIGTQDIGKYFEKDKFLIKGRMDNSDIRGCNLMYFQ